MLFIAHNGGKNYRGVGFSAASLRTWSDWRPEAIPQNEVLTSETMEKDKLHYIQDFEAFQKKAGRNSPQWIQRLRSEAMERFRSLNFPTTHDEEWRFTNLNPLVKIPFATRFTPSNITIPQIEPLLFGDVDWPRLVFVNGLYEKHLSLLTSVEGVIVQSLAGAFTSDERIRNHLAQHAVVDSNFFTSLNTAFLNDGACVVIPDGKILDKPLQLLFVSISTEARAFYPRVLIVTGKGSVATVLESHAGLSNCSYFSNAVTEVMIGEGAVLEHYRLQCENEQAFHISTTAVRQSRDSLYKSFSLTTGAELSRNNLNVLIDGEGVDCTLNGLYLIAGKQHVDHHTLIDHAKPHGTSREFYKGILSGKSNAVFNGSIIVRKDAQHTDARQTNKNLLLSEGSRVNTKPQLEILADDVKCSHGATIGHLEEDALFYLRSRGIGDRVARRLLMYGFVNEITRSIKMDLLREQVDRILLKKLDEFAGLQEVI
jgi:Fe-S cluster assembly protein SufD